MVIREKAPSKRCRIRSKCMNAIFCDELGANVEDM